jgi:hypothetical protein
VKAVLSLNVKLPLVPPPSSPEPAATPVIVPDPGKVCPAANLMMPLVAIESPVSVGVEVPEPNNKFSVPEGEGVLLPAGSAC